MTLYQPLWAQNTTYPAALDRTVFELFDPGVNRPDQFVVSQRGQGANMSVDISAGVCIIPGPFGNYICKSDAIENRPIAAPPAVGTRRVDLVAAQVTDNQATGAGDPAIEASWDLIVVTGNPHATNPANPPVPDFAIPLAYVSVAAGVVSVLDAHITDVRSLGAQLAQANYRGGAVVFGNQNAYVFPRDRPSFWHREGNNMRVERTGFYIASLSVRHGAANFRLLIQTGSGDVPIAYSPAYGIGGAYYCNLILAAGLAGPNWISYRITNLATGGATFPTVASLMYFPVNIPTLS